MQPILKKPYIPRRKPSRKLPILALLAIVIGAMIWHGWHPRREATTAKESANVMTPLPVPTNTAPVVQELDTNLQTQLKVVAVVTQAQVIVTPITITAPEPLLIIPQPLPVLPHYPRPIKDVFEAQIALSRRVISPGSIDSAMGSQTRAAIAAFQRSVNIPETGILDTNTRSQLVLESPLLTTYVVTSNDLEQLQPLGRTWIEKSQQKTLNYESVLELLSEMAHSHPLLIEKINRDVNWTNVMVGAVLKHPDAAYPDPKGKAAALVIHLSEHYLEAFDGKTNLLAHFPCSIPAKPEKRPLGMLHVSVMVANPNYTFDPEVFPESSEAQAIGHKLVLPAGPNNPVGVAWIGLDKPGCGIHGTPGPQQVGRTESHGCFRLANWDAEYLLKLAWIGMPVEVVR